MTSDASLAGTQRLTFTVDAYHNNRQPDGNPDEVFSIDVFLEADGTEITDPNRISAVLAKQSEDAINAKA